MQKENGLPETFEVTNNHPFYVLNTGWVDSGNLKQGMKLASYKNNAFKVKSLTPLDRSPVTYNFEVADFHTFFVGKSEVWVHNQGACDCSIAPLLNPDLSRISGKLKAAGLEVLANDIAQLEKFAKIVKTNNLGLDEDALLDVLKAPQRKGQSWDNPEKILDAVERSSSAGIDGLSIEHKKFPTPGENVSGYVLKNAKQYQAEGSGDAGLSFKKNGVSFDDVAPDGKLVDRKYGHGTAVFDEDGGVINEARAGSIRDQIQRQVDAVGGDASKVRWEISTDLGAKGISKLIQDLNLPPIEVKWVMQNTEVY